MPHKKVILIYNDSPYFGGHEIMTAHIANYLAKEYEVFFCFYNKKIGKTLNANLKKLKINISSSLPFAGIRSIFSKDLLSLKRIIKKIHPDLSIISQGTIELSLKGAFVSKILGIKTVSYIPLCFPFPKMGVKLGKIRDGLNRWFYYLFDAFITISNEQKDWIKKWNKNAKVFILPNLIEFNNSSFHALRTEYKENVLKIGVVGRISFKQKGQNNLINIAHFLKERGINFLIFVIGDGPDRPKLENLIKQEKLNKFFKFTGWIDDKLKIYSMIDFLLITSNFEGVPLNMLEAIAYNKPVLAPKKGIFIEYLPESFMYSNLIDIYKFIAKIFSNKSFFDREMVILRKKIFTLHSKENFRRNLFKIIESLW